MAEILKDDHQFKAKIEIIGINPFVFVPDHILSALFEQAGKTKSPIPIAGTINGKPYQQTLMKYQGAWRLYINTMMLGNSPRRIGETVELTVAFDQADRSIMAHPELLKALKENDMARKVFDGLTPR